MADRPQPHQIQVHPQHLYDVGGAKGFSTHQGPSTTRVLAVLTGVPVGGTLLALAGMALTVSLIGLALAAPLFVIFSPVLVPAAITIVLAVTGVLTSGAFALTALSSLSWMLAFLRQLRDHAKRRVADMATYAGQKTEEIGQDIQSKTQDVRRRSIF